VPSLARRDGYSKILRSETEADEDSSGLRSAADDCSHVRKTMPNTGCTLSSSAAVRLRDVKAEGSIEIKLHISILHSFGGESNFDDMS
jgi:hypothetical protein